jgi:hypothetical protein
VYVLRQTPTLRLNDAVAVLLGLYEVQRQKSNNNLGYEEKVCD